jgi:hypothetical protein
MLVLAALLVAGGSVSTAAREAGAAPSLATKKKCKFVKKRVHGHIKRVRVCKKRKPKPTVKSVSLTLETSHSASKSMVAGQGGTVTATASNGTKLTLIVPKDALLADTTVTMTPVASIRGLPQGSRFLGGVQLAPEGTALGKDATLTVETPAAASAKNPRAIGWEGDGKNPFAYGATRTGSAVQLKVIHFSGYAAEDGEQRWASAALDWLRLTYHQVHDLMVQATTTDSIAFGRAAIERWLNWERQAELLGGDDFMKSERQQLREVLLPQVFEHLINLSYAHCKDQHDVLQELSFLRGAQRQAQLLAFDNLSTLAMTRVEQCGRFELDVESGITWIIPGAHGSSRVRAKRLELNASDNWTDEKPLDYFQFEWVPDIDCEITLSTHADLPFRAELVSLGEAATQEPPKPPDPTKLIVSVFEGGATEKVTVTCPDEFGGPPVTVSASYHIWQDLFAALHGGASFTIKDWDYVGGSLYARKTYSQSGSSGEGSAVEQTSLELWHTPE